MSGTTAEQERTIEDLEIKVEKLKGLLGFANERVRILTGEVRALNRELQISEAKECAECYGVGESFYVR